VTVRNALLLVFCFIAAVLEASVPMILPHWARGLRGDLMLVVVLYVALHDDWIQGALLAFVAGYLSDLAAATPAGIYTFLAVLTFVILRTSGSVLKPDGALQAFALAFAVSLVHSLLAAGLFRLAITGSVFGLQWSWLLSAVATGLGAMPAFAILRALDEGLAPVGDSLGSPRKRAR
jgi:rod shape-determining protein MreD